MDKNKIHGFIDQLNLFLIGAVIGGIIGSCFSINAVKGKSNKAEELVTINHHVFRIVKGRCRNDNCIHCFEYDCNRFDFCIYKLPTDLHLEPISKHKG